MASHPPSTPAWVTVWAPTPQPTEPDDMPPAPFADADTAFGDTTIRQTLRITTGGDHIRFRLCNVFGSEPLRIASATVALPQPTPSGTHGGARAIRPDTLRHVRFSGASAVAVPQGAHATSDPVSLSVAAGTVVCVSLYLGDGHGARDVTSHPGSRTRSWLCRGDQTAAEQLTGPPVVAVAHWYFLSGVEAWADDARPRGTLVLLGDSITDGRGSTDDADNRWPDLLFDRMRAHPAARHTAVVNQAVGGGRVLRDGKGPSLMRRLDRDALGHAGVRCLLVFHGVNDIGTAPADAAALAAVRDALTAAYRQIVLRAHAHGIAVFGATIAPFGGSDPYDSCALRDRTRRDVNAWIRASRVFDAVVDFDALLRCPDDDRRLRPDFDSGDHLHPNVAAFHAMADAFPLDLFGQFSTGVRPALWELATP